MCARILNKSEMSQNLYDYYKEVYGEKDTDYWYEQPAVNVWVFRRDNKVITLKSHILTGEVDVKEEEI